MAQHDQHLTTEQLSAYLDKQLTPEEEYRCDSHLQTCEQCQQELAALRQTVTLLQALPQPPLPRSFVLSASMVAEPLTGEDALAPLEPPQRREMPSYISTTLRAFSALVAVAGLLLFLSGVLSVATFSGGTTAMSTAGNYDSAGGKAAPAVPPEAASPAATPHVTSNNGSQGVQSTPTVEESTPQRAPITPPPSWPDILFFNLSSPIGRLGLGILLVILGIMGYILFIRQRKRSL